MLKASRHQIKHKKYFLLAILLMICSAISAEPVPVESFVNFESAHVHPLDITPDRSQLLAVNTANNSLEVFRIEDAQLVHEASIPVGHDPVSVRARNNTEVWVANIISDSISIVDLNSKVVVRTLVTENEPSDIVFAGSPRKAFVSCAERESIQVFNLSNLDATPQEILLIGEQPRAMAVSPDGNTVYTAFFESGNQTTVISGNDFIAEGGLEAPFSGATVVSNDIRNPAGPYGGRVPIPNAGTGFIPPLNPELPPKTDTQSLVVKKQADGRWLDDNSGDWTNIVSGGLGQRVNGWDLKDRDVAILNANDFSLSYQKSLGNILMAMAVNPASGAVSVVGTDALNHIRFEPNLNGTFLRVNLAQFVPGNEAVSITDMNPHLDYSTATIPTALRYQSIGDPRGIAWAANGQKAYVTGMGSNNVIVMNANASRNIQQPIAVGEGPTGLVVDETRGVVYVLNKFSASISVVDTDSNTQRSETPFFDPTPTVIKTGRKHLYDTHKGSGNGTIACGSCHLDGKWDRLGWDLGNPAGEMQTVNGQAFHPLKGLKITQPLIDIIGTGALHWRGDKPEFSDFHTAFEDLKGRDPVSDEAMLEFSDFLSSTYHPPNPYRETSYNRPRNLNNLIRGPGTSFQNFTLGDFRGSGSIGFWHEACGGCHRNSTGKGPSGESFRAAQYDGNENMAPDLRSLYRKLGFYYRSPDSTVGFGMMSDGVVGTEFFKQQGRTDGYFFDYHAILLGYAGGGVTYNPSRIATIKPSIASQDSHYATGRQVTLNGAVGSAQAVNNLRALADNPVTLFGTEQNNLGLIVKGIFAGETRGFVYLGNNQYQSDADGQIVTHSNLVNAGTSNNGEPLTWTLVHTHVATRSGIDRDNDGILDYSDTGVLSGKVWLDSNENSSQDSNETSINGIDVYLFDDAWARIAYKQVANEGRYRFENLPAGNYIVCFDLPSFPANHEIVAKGIGLDDTDSDVNADGCTDIIELAPAAIKSSVDMGLVSLANATNSTINSLVWIDANKDGALSEAEVGVTSLQSWLFDSGWNWIAEGQSDINGQLPYTDLAFGDYYLCFDLGSVPANHQVTSKNAADEDLDSDSNEDGCTDLITLSAANADVTLGLGLKPLNESATASIISTVWLDEDGDAARSTDEPRVQNASSWLFDDNWNWVATGQSGSNGQWTYSQLASGGYYLCFDLGAAPANYQVTNKNAADDDVDSDSNEDGCTDLITLSAVTADVKIGLGLAPQNQLETGSIVSAVWLDENGDGSHNSNEPDVSNVASWLFDGSWNWVAEGESAGNGRLSYTDLPYAEYHICFDVSTFPSNHMITSKNAVADDMDSDFNIDGCSDLIVLTSETDQKRELGLAPM